jgi:dihydrofolate reductase
VVAELRKRRQQPGRNVHTWGSTDLLQTLLKNDLIDEYRLFIVPVVLGSGKRLFGSGTVPVALKQVESVTTGKGATYHRLERGGNRSTGRSAPRSPRRAKRASGRPATAGMRRTVHRVARTLGARPLA